MNFWLCNNFLWVKQVRALLTNSWMTQQIPVQNRQRRRQAEKQMTQRLIKKKMFVICIRNLLLTIDSNLQNTFCLENAGNNVTVCILWLCHQDNPLSVLSLFCQLLFPVTVKLIFWSFRPYHMVFISRFNWDEFNQFADEEVMWYGQKLQKWTWSWDCFVNLI